MPARALFLAAGLAAVPGTSSGLWAQVVRGNGATATSITVGTLSTGTVLDVSPAVSADRRYVGMGIDVQNSTLGGIDSFVLTMPEAGGGVQRAVAIAPVKFRPAVVGKVTFVDEDKGLLAAHVSAAELKGVSLKDAVRKLADASGENVVLGIRGLEQAGVDTKSPRDFSVAAGTMKEALLAIIRKAAPETEMVITAQDKVITVTTQAQADRALVTRTYALQDLLANVPRFVAGGTNLNDLGPERAEHELFRGTDMTRPPGVVASAQGRKAAPTRPADPLDITDLVTSTVRPEIWKNHGGAAEIHRAGDHVVVRAPESVHAILAGPAHGNPDHVDSYYLFGQ